MTELATQPDDLLPKTPALDDESPFATMMSLFDEAAAKLGIAPENYAILRKPDREITVSVPVRMDDGSLAVIDGYRVQHNQGLGPFIGPLRISLDLSVDMLRALAAWLTWKCALLNIPFGGAAGGIRMDVVQRSRHELERAVRRYTASMLDVVGSDRDIFAPDIGADHGIMAWVVETVSSHQRHTDNASVTGKPPSMAGTRGHSDAVAQGLRVIFRHTLDHFELSGRGVKVVIQGAGAVGSLDVLPLAWRLVNAPIAYALYLWKTVWPVGLASFYPHPGLLPSQDLASVLPASLALGLGTIAAWIVTRPSAVPE